MKSKCLLATMLSVFSVASANTIDCSVVSPIKVVAEPGECSASFELEPILVNGYNAHLSYLNRDIERTVTFPLGTHIVDWTFRSVQDGSIVAQCPQEITVIPSEENYFDCSVLPKYVLYKTDKDSVTTEEIFDFLSEQQFLPINICSGMPDFSAYMYVETGTLIAAGEEVTIFFKSPLYSGDLSNLPNGDECKLTLFVQGEPTSAKESLSDNRDELVNVYTVEGILVKSNVSKCEATNGLPNGFYLVGKEKVAVIGR